MKALSHDAHPVLQPPRSCAVVDDFDARLRQAAVLIPDQPDDAALLVDGLLREIVDEWRRLRSVALAPASAVHALDVVQQMDPLFGWRLRLALRAPDVRSRLAHCRSLIAALSESGA